MADGAAPRIDKWMLPGELARIAADRATGAPARRTPRDWAVDLVMFTFAVVMAAVEQLALAVPLTLQLPPWLRVVDPVLGVACCLALWWRRPYPVATGVLAAVGLALSNTASPVAVVLLFSLALHRGWRWAVPVTAGALLLGAPYIYAYFPAAIGPPALWMFAVTLGAALVVSAGLGVRARRQLVVALRQRADDERREHARQLEESRRAERQLIAREMHDVLAHRISLLSVHAGALEYRTAQAERGTAAPPSAADVHHAVSVVRSNANQALAELRDVLHLLRSPGSTGDAEDRRAAPQPTLERLPALVDEARRSGQRVELDLDGALTSLRPQVQRTVFRTVQEGLTNARKHAPGAAVDVRARVGDADDVLVEISNAVPLGITSGEIPGAGAGITGLTERVRLHGGHLASGISDGRFRLRVRIPSTA
ncbi:histidine kinase [Actinomycetes bacterium KLBMP 9759]